jgi:hypothetical protein
MLTDVGCVLPGWRGVQEAVATWRRVALATVAPAVQIALSCAVADRMRPLVRIHNLRVKCFKIHDVLDRIANNIEDKTSCAPVI